MRRARFIVTLIALWGCDSTRDHAVRRPDAGNCAPHCDVPAQSEGSDDACKPRCPGAAQSSGGSDEDGGGPDLPSPLAPCAPTPKDQGVIEDLPLPRNIIVLMGDGMGPNHVEAARLVADRPLAFDELEGPVLYETRSLDMLGPTDSGAGATAMATGQCTNNFFVGVDPLGVPMTNIGELAAAQGKRVGALTNTIPVDASPMAFLVHATSRYCPDEMAHQLFTTSLPDLLLGGFVPDESFADAVGLDEQARDAGYVVAFDLPALRKKAKQGDRVLGLFGEGPSVKGWPDWAWGLTPENLRAEDSDEPTLAEMTTFALDHLDGDDGFLVFIENEHTDTVGHDSGTNPIFARDQLPLLVLELEQATRAAIDWVKDNASFEDTLLIVCADHETAGYMIADGDPSVASFPGAPHHTDTPVPLYARGPGADRIGDVQHTTDIFLLLTGQTDQLPTEKGCPPAAN